METEAAPPEPADVRLWTCVTCGQPTPLDDVANVEPGKAHRPGTVGACECVGCETKRFEARWGRRT